MSLTEQRVIIKCNSQEINIPLGENSVHIDFIGFEKDISLSANSKQYFDLLYNQSRFGSEPVLFMVR